jgi:hypothetical protein
MIRLPRWTLYVLMQASDFKLILNGDIILFLAVSLGRAVK